MLIRNGSPRGTPLPSIFCVALAFAKCHSVTNRLHKDCGNGFVVTFHDSSLQHTPSSGSYSSRYSEKRTAITPHIIMHSTRTFRPFLQARVYARSLCLKRSADWISHCKSGERPSDIPVCPQIYYKDSGWSGYGDWLGNGKTARTVPFAKFEIAQEWAIAQGFTTAKEFRKCKRPPNIPSCPEATYKTSGWQGFIHFLGSNNRSSKPRVFATFKDAHLYALSLGIKTKREWWRWSTAGHRPFNIPSCPHTTYADCGWRGWRHWLGTGDANTIINLHRYMNRLHTHRGCVTRVRRYKLGRYRLLAKNMMAET